MKAEELLEKWENYQKDIKSLQADIDFAKICQKHLMADLQVAGFTEPVFYNGSWYQVRRKRGNLIMYCSDKKPGSWLNKKENNNETD